MLQIDKLRKQFGSVVAVDDVSFQIAEPQMVGVIGRSGAGKSTLLRIINRLTDATAGRILLDDADILRLKGAKKLA